MENKLMSMVDFVLYQGNPSNTDSQFSDKVMAYANFLKQPLELWMFVPCKLVDGIWVVLEEPESIEKRLKIFHPNHAFEFNGWQITLGSYRKDFKEAKDRVLFEGFEYKGETDFSWIFKHEKSYPVLISKRDIEYLTIIFNRNIELTPTALKQIGL